MAYTDRPTGIALTTFGSDREPSGLGVNSKTGSPSFLKLISANGTESYIWARNDGKWYGGSATNLANAETQGTALW